MQTQQLARGVWQFTGFPRYFLNCYLVEDVLIDAATRWAKRRLLGQLRGRCVRLVALTHCHPDHQGLAKVLTETLQAPLACHAADGAAVEGRAPMQPDNRIVRLGVRWLAGPPCPVGQVLQDGDEVGGFRVMHAPGHTPGHVIFFREADRVAIAGDLLANIHFLTGRPGLQEPPPFFSADCDLNRQSVRMLAALRPAIVGFGHGPPLRDPLVLEAFAAKLAAGGSAWRAAVGSSRPCTRGSGRDNPQAVLQA